MIRTLVLGFLATVSVFFVGPIENGAVAANAPPLKLRLAESGWGNASRENVRVVLREAAEPLLLAVKPGELPVVSVDAKGGPIVLFRRGPNGELLVRLNTGDLFWSQYIYQFSHEMCHILSEFDEDPHGNSWFEESLCEMASLYVLRQLGAKWKHSPPYSNWRGYSANLTSYAQKRIDAAALPEGVTFTQWYREHAQHLHNTAVKRELNAVVANELLPLFEKKPHYWQALRYINASQPTAPIPLREFLRQWRENVPAGLREAVDEISLKFGVDFLAVKTAQNLRFELVALSSEFQSEGATAADVDSDGHLDVISGPFWYAGPDYRQRYRYTPGQRAAIKGYSKFFFCFTADINRDGHVDILTIPIPGQPAYWFANPGPTVVRDGSTTWKRYPVHKAVGGESPTLTDMTGDGFPELIGVEDGRFGYASFSPHNPEAWWEFTPITPNRGYGRFTHGMGVGDVDGDGRADLLETNGWWQQTENHDSEFVFHEFRFAKSGGAQMYAYDFDGDGDNDILSVQNAHGWGLTWFERRGDPADGIFIPHVILPDTPATKRQFGISQMHSVALFDMDRDGVLDIVTGKRFWAHGGRDPGAQQLPVLYWFRTTRQGKSVSFEPRRISNRAGVGTQLEVRDLDGNGFGDVIVGNKLGTSVAFAFAADETTPPAQQTVRPALIGGPEFAKAIRTTEPLSPQDELSTFTLPPGFEIQLVASEPDIAKPMNLAFDARGRLWVSSSEEYPFPAPDGQTGKDTIKILEDTNDDGKADRITTFADNLNIPIGLYPYQNGVVCHSIPNLWFLADRNGDGRADTREKLFGPIGFERDTHGMCNGFTRGLDGWLYACHGFNNHTKLQGTDGHEVKMHSGNTFRMRLDGSRIEQFTHGQVNPFGMAMDSWGDLFTADCHTKPITLLIPNGYYESFGKPHDGLGFVPNVMEHLHGSTAIGGIAICETDRFPVAYRGNAFGGNVMTSRVNRNSLRRQGGSMRAIEEPDFLISSDPWFRPVDLKFGPDGALYVADFYNRIIGHYEVKLDHPGRDRKRGRIWRIVYTGKGRRDAAPPAVEQGTSPPSTLPELFASLAANDLNRAMLASHRITDEYPAADAAALARETLATTADENQAWQCLWILYRSGGLKVGDLENAVEHDSAKVRTHAFRILAAWKSVTDIEPELLRDLLRRGLGDKSAMARRCAAQATMGITSPGLVTDLLQANRTTPQEDFHTRHQLKMALRAQLLPAGVLAKLPPELPAEDTAAIAEICLAIQTPAAGQFLAGHLGQLPNIELKQFEKYLAFSARYAAPEDVAVIAQLAQQRFGRDLELQAKLLASVKEGLEQRGEQTLPPSIRKWVLAITRPVLQTSPADVVGWQQIPHPQTRATELTWSITRTRRSADGRQKTKLHSSFPHGEQRTAIYRSGTFPLPAEFSFYLAGHDGYPEKPLGQKNYVQLRHARNHQVLKKWNAPRNDTAQRMHWASGEQTGQLAYIELVDGDTAGAYAWLAAGRFSVDSLNSAQQSANYELAAKLSDQFQLQENRELLQQLAKHKNLSSSVTMTAVSRALVRLGKSSNERTTMLALAEIPTLSTVPNELRRRAVDAIAGEATRDAEELLSLAMQSATSPEQNAIAEILSSDKQGAELLLRLVASGKMSARILTNPSFVTRLRTLGDDIASKAQSYTKDLPDENQQVLTRIKQRLSEIERQPGDATAGAKLFTQKCATCHQIAGKGKKVGPNLDGIGNRGLTRLLEDVFLPNRNVDVAFRSSTVVTDDGKVLSGLVKREEGARTILVNNKGEEISIATSSIEEKRSTQLSPMPANFSELLTETESRNLFAFLLNQTR